MSLKTLALIIALEILVKAIRQEKIEVKLLLKKKQNYEFVHDMSVYLKPQDN